MYGGYGGVQSNAMYDRSMGGGFPQEHEEKAHKGAGFLMLCFGATMTYFWSHWL